MWHAIGLELLLVVPFGYFDQLVLIVVDVAQVPIDQVDILLQLVLRDKRDTSYITIVKSESADRLSDLAVEDNRKIILRILVRDAVGANVLA